MSTQTTTSNGADNVRAALDKLRLPQKLAEFVAAHGDTTVIAGSFLTWALSSVARQRQWKPNDVDIFTTDPAVMPALTKLLKNASWTSHTTAQVPVRRYGQYPVQRWYGQYPVQRRYGQYPVGFELHYCTTNSLTHRTTTNDPDPCIVSVHDFGCIGRSRTSVQLIVVHNNMTVREFVHTFDFDCVKGYFDGQIQVAPGMHESVQAYSFRFPDVFRDMYSLNSALSRAKKYERRQFTIAYPPMIRVCNPDPSVVVASDKYMQRSGIRSHIWRLVG